MRDIIVLQHNLEQELKLEPLCCNYIKVIYLRLGAQI